ncbi:U6 snRNA-associated Sm-like protein LSm4 isoform X1 [Physeter macrocephalus]|uniref:U6 snRNA-associated Sm-like protein LSm4 n=1 Tax=Physeter macrocephalus TaxID=9755 RepID=A0A455C6H8_PHYMC|nr:U6 snRNA-associated Sm-like protein LSm4 isoform X1 [Physeter catodon]|eukprot:XP_028357024.1 U6 snRNA-associated Sm-like protein LSm4 isoform X1 [Physeter catodon]
MLHLWLLKTAQNHPLLVELKNGETYNGHLVSCDNWTNINLREVICKSRDRDKFWLMPECYLRSSTIKYLRIPDEIIDTGREEVAAKGRGCGGRSGRRWRPRAVAVVAGSSRSDRRAMARGVPGEEGSQGPAEISQKGGRAERRANSEPPAPLFPRD